MVNKFCCVEEIPKNLIRKLYELQKTSELCDYELTTKDGGSFKVHKWVLSTVSSFFNKLFNNSEFNNSNSDSLLIHQASKSSLEKIVEFIYTGEVEISSDVAKEIIDVALFLDLDILINHCIKVLIEILNEENCLDLLKFSETCVHLGADLTKECLKLICKNFDEFVNKEDFCTLSSVTIKALVKQDRFAYTEEDLYLAVRKWIIFDLESRESFMDDLIGGIKLGHCSREFALANILKNNSLLESPIFNQILINHLGNIWTTTKELTTEEKIKVLQSELKEENKCKTCIQINCKSINLKKRSILTEDKKLPLRNTNPFAFSADNLFSNNKPNDEYFKSIFGNNTFNSNSTPKK